MVTVARDNNYTRIANSVKPDPKRRVSLPKVVVTKGITYHIYTNDSGQILLDPQVTIPASEAWLYSNPEALASVRRGLADAAAGRVSRVNPDTL